MVLAAPNDVRTPAEPGFLDYFAGGVSGRQRTGYSDDAQWVIYWGPDEDFNAGIPAKSSVRKKPARKEVTPAP